MLEKKLFGLRQRQLRQPGKPPESRFKAIECGMKIAG
jgi:hypothetical protein